MVKIILGNNKSRVIATTKTLSKLRRDFKIRAKNYFWSPAYRQQKWDGYVRYISEVNGSFSTGLLDQVVELLKEQGKKYEIVDNRELFNPIHKVEDLNLTDFESFFDHQHVSLQAFLENRVAGIKFLRGILAEATNAGKSVIAAAIFAMFAQKRRGIFLVNSKTLFTQALRDLKKLFPDEVGQVSADKTDWKRINVCMVQTLGNRIKNPEYRNYLAQTDIMIVDEGDELIGRKDCKDCLNTAFNAVIRICLSGTPLMSKDKCRNQDLLAYFGPVINTTTNKQLVDAGISTPPDIRVYTGSRRDRGGSYKEQLDYGIIKNKYRHRRIWKRVDKQFQKKRGPMVILFRYEDHARRLMRECPEDIQKIYRIEVVHHKTPGREQIFEDFNNGKVDILIASMIIRRGINLPLIKTLINAAGGDGEEGVLQILGRLLRKHKSKKKVWFIDYYDEGKYLRRHSKHRINYYKKQKFEVKEIYKKAFKKSIR